MTQKERRVCDKEVARCKEGLRALYFRRGNHAIERYIKKTNLKKFEFND